MYTIVHLCTIINHYVLSKQKIIVAFSCLLLRGWGSFCGAVHVDRILV